ncbi:papain family cysteine protease, partial [Ancylostoma ceylanicum]
LSLIEPSNLHIQFQSSHRRRLELLPRHSKAHSRSITMRILLGSFGGRGYVRPTLCAVQGKNKGYPLSIFLPNSTTKELIDMRVTMCGAYIKLSVTSAPAFRHRYLGLLWRILRKRNVCKPYAFYPCGNHTNEIWYGKCPNYSWPTPKCRKTCKYGYKKSYEKDKYYAKSAYILPNDVEAIKQEIMDNGPVQAVFDVYEDFRLYKKGIYKV